MWRPVGFAWLSVPASPKRLRGWRLQEDEGSNVESGERMTETTDFSIRDVRDSDAADIATIFALGCAWAYREFFPAQVLANYTPQRQMKRWTDRLANLTRRDRILVATESDAVIGFIEIGPAASASDNMGEVRYLFVHPSRTGHGIGRQLMRTGEAGLAQLGYLTAILWVFRDNSYARAFYERLGWTATGGEELEPTLAQRGFTIIECEYRRHLGFHA